MLLNLSIKNFAIVRQLEIDWQNGMTTITGETGAGKSIAIDALGLCLGERTITNVVRPKCKKAELAATFDINKNKNAKAYLTQQELLQQDEQKNECILRRVISSEGRSKAYINGSQVPISQLKELGNLLINIHGQHDHQLIVKTQQQRHMLDAYANNYELLGDVKYQYTLWRNLTTEFSLLQQDKIQREAKQQLLQYQVQELDDFNLQANEFEAIESDYKRHSHAQDLLNDTLQGIFQLSANEQFNIVDSLRQVSESMMRLSNVDSKLCNIAQLLNDAILPIEEANADLKHYHEQLELDPETFLALEQRYSTTLQLAKKHQVQPENLPELHCKLKQELKLLSGDENRLSQIITDIDSAKQSYLTVATQLSQSRLKSAKTLSRLISKSMQELNMPDSQFCVQVNNFNRFYNSKKIDNADLIINSEKRCDELTNKELSSHGIDEVNFVVSINPGQPLEAMHKVASGGELSRIGLAIQVILAEKVITPTLIFDEVDVGISGSTAALVGKKLQQLGKNTQVICVTHLPQVASKGHQQLFVSKFTDNEHTETTVTELNQLGRVREIARLLAGDTITDSSLANAKELLTG